MDSGKKWWKGTWDLRIIELSKMPAALNLSSVIWSFYFLQRETQSSMNFSHLSQAEGSGLFFDSERVPAMGINQAQIIAF